MLMHRNVTQSPLGSLVRQDFGPFDLQLKTSVKTLKP